jgi:hypothetical protein
LRSPVAVLINCVAYEDGNRLADCRIDAIGDYVKRPRCFVWVAPKDASADELATRQGEFASTQGFLGVRARAEREPHLLKHGSAFVFYALLDAVVDRYFRSSTRSRPTSSRSRTRSSSRRCAATTANTSAMYSIAWHG